MLYHFHGDQSKFSESEFQQAIYSDAPTGNITIKAKSAAEFYLELAVDQPIRLTHYFSRNADEVNWRRDVDIVRTRGGDFTLFRFLTAGTVQSVTSRETMFLKEGHFSITRGDASYMTKSFPNVRGVHESFQVYVPLFRVAHLLPDEGFTGSFSCATAMGATAIALVRTLFLYGEHVDLTMRERLADALIEAMIQCVHHERNVKPRRGGIGKARLSTIIQFIHDNGARRGLRAAMVAKECGISRRYMSSLLAREGVYFKDLLREARLARAEDMLASASPAERTVAEVANLSGFESPAYFSRVFKSTHGISPRQFRADRQAATPARREGGFFPEQRKPATRRPDAATNSKGAS